MIIKNIFSKIFKINLKKMIPFLLGTAMVVLILSFVLNIKLNSDYSKLSIANSGLEKQFSKVQSELTSLKNQDQFKRNEALQKEIENINKTYKNSVTAYETILDLDGSNVKTAKYSDEFAKILTLLSERNYASAASNLTDLNKELDQEKSKLVSSFTIPQNVVSSNSPPGGGYSRQSVTTSVGTFMADIISADLGSTRIIVDTASESDCGNDCPVLSLADYVGRNGAYAGVNGSYFCPASYPSCAGKTNTFDTLLMNKNKRYFNSDNNVYSTVPAVIFGGGWIRFVGRSLDWGRDTGIDSMIANQPLLLSGGNIVFGGDGDPKKGSKGSRSFVGANGNTVYIGVVHNATVAEVAYALKALGMSEALNLDNGGSTALWYGGYKVGPGRNIPNAISFVKK